MARDHTCLAHPEAAAVARCQRCSTPICQGCVDAHADGPYCSDECKRQADEFATRRPAIDKHRGGMVKWLLRLVSLLVVAAAALYVAGNVLGIGAAKGILRMVGL